MNSLAGRLEKEIKFYEKMDEKLKGRPKIFNEYYIYLRANKYSYTSIGVYINNVLHFVRFLGDDITEDFYNRVTMTDIESYMMSLETRETKSGTKRMGDDILQTRWSSLNRFFDFLVKRGYVKDNPILLVNRPKNQTEHKVVYLSQEEIDSLMKAIGRNLNRVAAARDKALIGLALSTGLRVSALVNINIEDIDFENSIINVIEKRKKVREIHIGDNIKSILKSWISIREESFEDLDTSALFISQKKTRLSVGAANDALTKYCDNAGIKRITPHKLRATAACALAKNNIPVKAIAHQLGHDNIATTMRYIDVFNEDIEKSQNILDHLF